jgi:phosphatidylglycerol:prolipoprotein diacylglycerol transferase
MDVTLFGIDLKINPQAFKIGEFTVYWYGIIIGLGFLLAVIYAMKNAPRFSLDKDRMLDVVLVVTPVSILCARAYFCFFPYENGSRITSFKEFFGIGTNEGFRGLAIYGAVIGAFVAGYVMCKLRKVKVLDMFDIASVGFLIGQGIGRWGNFFNQEAFGAATGSDWFGMMSKNTGGVNVHPCFLYESLWCICGFFVLNYFSKKRKFSGEMFFMYGVWYGFGRFFIEYLRTDSLMIGKMKVSMLVSALIFIVCLALLLFMYQKSKRVGLQTEYTSLFKEQLDDVEANVDEVPREDISENTEVENTEVKEEENV